MNCKLSDVQVGFRKGREIRDQIANILWIIKKARKFQKNILLFYWLCQSLSLCGSQQTVENSSRDGNTKTTWPASREIFMQVKKQQLESDMEQWTGSKLGKEYIKAVYCYPAYLTCMQSTSCEMPGWIKCKLDSRLPGEISVTLYMHMTPPLWQKVKRN